VIPHKGSALTVIWHVDLMLNSVKAWCCETASFPVEEFAAEELRLFL
jgi:hypothetical protein